MLKDLTDFVPPQEGEITICEMDGRIHTNSCRASNTNTITNATEKHPNITITKDSLHSKSTDECREIFLPVQVSVLKHLTQIYYEHGSIEMLRDAATQPHYLISKTANILLKCIGLINNFRSIMSPHLKKDSRTCINNVTRVRNWHSSPIRCISWNQYDKKIAVAMFDDNVKIFYNGTSTVTVLKVKHQRNITCLAWRPMCISELAVGCEECIIIWNVDPSSIIARPSSGCATCLFKLEHRPIVSLTWSPIGDILISAAACDSQLYVWDIDGNRSSKLKRHATGNTIVEYSSKGDRLFSASNGVIFRVWETRTWVPERWNLLSGRVQASCWCPCNTVLLFCTNEEPLIYCVSFSESDLVYASNAGNSPNKATPLYDISKRELNDSVLVGGVITNMIIDAKGDYLALLFRETNYIAVFKIIMQPTLQLTPNCFVSGMPEEIPNVIDFQKNFDGGACLSIGWSSGRLQHFPIIGTDVNARTNMHQALPF